LPTHHPQCMNTRGIKDQSQKLDTQVEIGRNSCNHTVLDILQIKRIIRDIVNIDNKVQDFFGMLKHIHIVFFSFYKA